MAQPRGGERDLALLCDEVGDGGLVGLGRRRAEGERYIREPEFEEPVAPAGLAIVIPLRDRLRQDVDLPGVQAEAVVDRGDLRLQRALVRQEDPCRAGFDDGRGDRAAIDIGERLGREDDARVLLAQRLQPFLQLRAKGRIVQRQPPLVDEDQCRRPGQAALDPVEEVGQYGRCRGSADQPLGLEGLDVRIPKRLGLGVEQPAPGSVERVGLQCLLQVRRLQDDGEPGQASLLDRGRGEAGERRPDMVAGGRADLDPLAAEQPGDPGSGPDPLGIFVDPRQRLQRDGQGVLARERAAEIVPIAAHGQRRRPDRAPEIEGEDLRTRIAAELQRHERKQHALARAGRPDDKPVADIAHMGGEAERRRPRGLRVEERRTVQMIVPGRSRPDGRERDHMGEVQRRDRRLAHIRIEMAGQGAEPGLDRVDALADDREVAALDDLLGDPEVVVRDLWVRVHHRERRGDMGPAGDIRAELLQRLVGIDRLVGRVRIQKRRGLVGHDLLEDRADALALGEPLAADAGQQLCRVGLVEEDRPGRPAIGEGEPVEVVEDAGEGRRREADDRERPQVMRAQARLQPAGEGRVGQERVEMHRRLRDADALRDRRDAAVQIGERLGIREPDGFGEDALQQVEQPIRAVDETGDLFGGLRSGRAVAALVEPAFGAGCVLGRRQPDGGEDIPALEMGLLLFELRLPFGFDHRRDRIGEGAFGIVLRRNAAGFREERPAGPEASERSVEPGRRGD